MIKKESKNNSIDIMRCMIDLSSQPINKKEPKNSSIDLLSQPIDKKKLEIIQ